MGFKKDAWATVWSVEDGKNNSKKVRISTSKKNKLTDVYEQDFSGYCFFYAAAAQKAAMLKPKDKIKIGDSEVVTVYNKDEQKEYTIYRVYDFEKTSGASTHSTTAQGGTSRNRKPQVNIQSNPYEGDSNIEDDLPF